MTEAADPTSAMADVAVAPKRFLSSFDDSGADNLPADSSIAIAWYCILLLVTILVFAFLCFCAYAHCRTRRLLRLEEEVEEEDERQGQIDLEIARIEANVKIFAEKQEFMKKKHLHRVMKGQFAIVEAEDLDENNTRLNLGEGCSICMEPFQVGDRVAHALDMEKCAHLFHDDCILSWFVSRPEQRCPCCRQQFADILHDEEPPQRHAAPSPAGPQHAVPSPADPLEAVAEETASVASAPATAAGAAEVSETTV